MKRSFTKYISVVLVLMMAFTAAFACMASAETTVVKDDSSLNSVDTASDTITSIAGARDIFLVLDVSGSMSGTPITKLKEAAKEFCAIMLDDTTAQNRIVIITYGTTVTTYSFSTDYAELANIIDSLEAKGSTDMYDALMAVKEINENYGNANATKHVVVMADGLPNEGATLSSGKYTSKDSSMYYKYGNAVYSTAAGMWEDYLIYSIGFFHSLSGTQLTYGKTLMKDIQNALYLEVYDPDQIRDAFFDIAEDITTPSTSANDATTAAPATTAAADDNTTTTAPTTAEPATASTTAAATTNTSIPKTGETAVGVAAAALVLAAGIVFVAVKKKD
ncbi:MAG: VWA domain-containing protein [Clostridiales bacterium]|nr:VWA domain-containing protein [Clostridiales bacterium]